MMLRWLFLRGVPTRQCHVHLSVLVLFRANVTQFMDSSFSSCVDPQENLSAMQGNLWQCVPTTRTNYKSLWVCSFQNKCHTVHPQPIPSTLFPAVERKQSTRTTMPTRHVSWSFGVLACLCSLVEAESGFCWWASKIIFSGSRVTSPGRILQVHVYVTVIQLSERDWQSEINQIYPKCPDNNSTSAAITNPSALVQAIPASEDQKWNWIVPCVRRRVNGTIGREVASKTSVNPKLSFSNNRKHTRQSPNSRFRDPEIDKGSCQRPSGTPSCDHFMPFQWQGWAGFWQVRLILWARIGWRGVDQSGTPLSMTTMTKERPLWKLNHRSLKTWSTTPCPTIKANKTVLTFCPPPCDT